ncbi:MAG: bifunctional diaminohydroxyphosphoribosylaminopyrimidine deaminase/5-amino-6-(5-phosphoribosylamino)uracil reductase RibD, partial [Acidimicrobiia bacterium]
MRRALALADGVRRTTAPNPWVGCVIVRDGEIVGEGSTAPPGGPHAEAVALAAAGERARG